MNKTNQTKKTQIKIRKETTQMSAERYQNWLYGRFDHVRLIEWPRFASTGTFKWEVR